MSFQTIAYSVQGQLTLTTVVTGLWQKHNLVYKPGENYGYDSVTWIHPPLFTLWTTYRSHTDAYIVFLCSEPWETL